MITIFKYTFLQIHSKLDKAIQMLESIKVGQSADAAWDPRCGCMPSDRWLVDSFFFFSLSVCVFLRMFMSCVSGIQVTFSHPCLDLHCHQLCDLYTNTGIILSFSAEKMDVLISKMQKVVLSFKENRSRRILNNNDEQIHRFDKYVSEIYSYLV